ncbi:MAG: dual specificity protein phosphatase family protein [Cyanothece sp. SIO1E1]|nr:dual specificity protein phosphatase family protein [Cyanothece sp. SIO1E1]
MMHVLGGSTIIANPSKSCLNWIIPGQLAMGRLPRVADIHDLMLANIGVVFSLCAETEGVLSQELSQSFQCLRYVLPDSHYAEPLRAKQLIDVVEIIHQYLQVQTPVYIHCLAGMERSPTVCTAYLCRYHGLELWEALNWVKQVRPKTKLVDSQIKALREFVQSCG